ncbi:MAG TPA: hypothetical protein VM093_03850 [Aeromicrobium sp.]|nr:hypothetical protein [Aeromicrobium sp.]
MPINQRELRDLLDERSRPALERPIPWHALRARPRGSRRLRLSAVAVAVAVVAAGAFVSLGGPDEVDQPTSAQVTEKLPAQYEESDGTVYRRLATVTFDPSKEKSKTFPVEVSGKPVAILPDCPSTKTWPPQVTARVPGKSKTYTLSPTPFLMNSCAHGTAVDMVPFPAGTQRVTFTVKAIDKPSEGKWRFGVYEWTPPATAKVASPPVEPPVTIGRKLNLITKGSATWPASREVTVTLPAKGRNLAIVVYCGGDLAERMPAKLWVNGRLLKGLAYCGFPPTAMVATFTSWGRGKRSLDDETVTIKVRLGAPIPEYLRRSGTLTVAVYNSDI